MSILEGILYALISLIFVIILTKNIIEMVKIHKLKKMGYTNEQIKELLKKKKDKDEE